MYIYNSNFLYVKKFNLQFIYDCKILHSCLIGPELCQVLEQNNAVVAVRQIFDIHLVDFLDNHLLDYFLDNYLVDFENAIEYNHHCYFHLVVDYSDMMMNQLDWMVVSADNFSVDSASIDCMVVVHYCTFLDNYLNHCYNLDVDLIGCRSLDVLLFAGNHCDLKWRMKKEN